MGNTSSIGPHRRVMKIHNVHGKNLKLSNNGLLATRHEGYADALFFGSRPSEKEEQVEVTITKMVKEWNGSIRFGFTTHDPVNIARHPEGIPRYMCPDLIKRGGSYVETISHISLREKDKIVFWVNDAGEVKFMINNTNQRCQLQGITKPVWPVVDVYGNTTEVFFRSLSDDYVRNIESVEPRFYNSLNLIPFNLDGSMETVEQVDHNTLRRKTMRKAYIWNQQSLTTNTVWIVFVRDVDESIRNKMTIAITTVCPSAMNMKDDLSSLHGAQVFRNVYARMQSGDELAICILKTGSVMAALNGEAFQELGKVTASSSYWIIGDLNCGVVSLTSLGIYKINRFPLPRLPNFPTEKLPFIKSDSFPLSTDRPVSTLSQTSQPGSSLQQSGPPIMSSQNSERSSVLESVTSASNSQNSAPAPDYGCLKCKKTADAVLVPCGHVIYCLLCCNDKAIEKCVVCNKRIDSRYKVYF